MPDWLYTQLKRGPQIRKFQTIGHDGKLVIENKCQTQVSGIVPALAKLSEISITVTKAYFCHPSVQHVFQDRNEGGFCGYRNIQMLISYMQGIKARGHSLFGLGLPGVLELQDMIEAAWDMGIGEHGRRETGESCSQSYARGRAGFV